MDQARLLRVYRRWAPIYDALVGPLASRPRRRVMTALELRPGDRLVIPGCGTGLDLPLLPEGVRVVALDLSSEMLERARRKRTRARVELRLGDAMALDLPEASFDAALLNLIVAVAPDGARVITEALRVLRPGGRMVIFDKFLPDDRAPGPLRRRLGAIVDRLGTDPNRRLGDLLGDRHGLVVSDEPAGGPYRIVVLRKPGEPTDGLGL